MADMRVGVFIVLSFVALVKGCDDGWTGHGNSCYLFVGTKEPWVQAGQVCANHRATLVAIESYDENSFVEGYVKVMGDLGANFNVWLAGNDMDIEGRWEWSPSGNSVHVSDWGPGEPSGDGDCMALWRGLRYHWNDSPCTLKRSFMCEKPKVTDTVIG